MTSQTIDLDQHSGTAATVRPAPIPLPAPGPIWYPSVMGTGILSTLTQIHAGSTGIGQWLAMAWLIVGWGLLLGLTAAFGVRIARDVRALTNTIHDTGHLAMWGTVSMGLLAVGAATETVIPAQLPAYTHAAGVADAVLWTLGTVLGVATAIGFGALLVGRTVGTPTAVWGLPIVPPMVSATTGSALVPLLGSDASRLWMSVATVACFFLGLSLGVVVFGVVYHNHWRHNPVPLAASASTWIPLGIVGQSTAAAQAMASQAEKDVLPGFHNALQMLANTYGWVTLSIGVPLVIYAVVVTTRGFLRRMPFTPGWWALTFPVGTLSLGSHLLGGGSGVSVMTWMGHAWWIVLIGTWTLAATASVVTVARRTVGARQAVLA